MKSSLTKIFWIILNRFEQGDGPYEYKTSSRAILLIVGLLFSGLSGGSLYFSILNQSASAFLPVVVFFAVGTVCLVVGLLGSDRAVATLWGNSRKEK